MKAVSFVQKNLELLQNKVKKNGYITDAVLFLILMEISIMKPPRDIHEKMNQSGKAKPVLLSFFIRIILIIAFILFGCHNQGTAEDNSKTRTSALSKKKRLD